MTKKIKYILGFFLLCIYRFFIRFWMQGNCRFFPSCSVYAWQSFVVYPFGRALYLVIKRLRKCHPWGGSGYDPVPGCQGDAQDHIFLLTKSIKKHSIASLYSHIHCGHANPDPSCKERIGNTPNRVHGDSLVHDVCVQPRVLKNHGQSFHFGKKFCKNKQL